MLLVFSGFLISCTKNEEKIAPASAAVSSTSTGTAEGVSSLEVRVPVVTSASIVPEKPTGDATLGVQLEGHDPDNRPITYRFRWYIDNNMVQDGPDSTLLSKGQKKGSVIYVEIVPSVENAVGSPFATTPVTIFNKPPTVKACNIKPLPAYSGTMITAVPDGVDVDGDPITYTYKWNVNGNYVSGATDNASFSTEGLRKRDVIKVLITPSDNESTGEPVESGKITLSNSPPQITSSPPTGFENNVYTYQIVAKDPDGDALTYSLMTSPPGMTIDNTKGLVRWQLPRVETKQEVTIKVSVDDRDGGVAYQEFSLVLEPAGNQEK